MTTADATPTSAQPAHTLAYDVTFRDFQFLQNYMTRRVFARNRGQFIRALLGVVLCAVFIGIAIYAYVRPYRVSAFFSYGVPYPLSFYLFLIVCLLAAILALIPAINLRVRTLRMQVSDDGPFLGPTRLVVESDGLAI